MSQKITIRNAVLSDAANLTELGVTTFVAAFGAGNTKEDMDKYLADAMSLEKIQSELADPSNIFYLAFLDDKLVGYCKVRATETPPELAGTEPIEIERIYVLQEYHGSKIGAALMDQCIAHARKHNHRAIWLGVWEHNTKAVNFYKRWGFEFFGSHGFLLGYDQQTDMLMKKIL